MLKRRRDALAFVVADLAKLEQQRYLWLDAMVPALGKDVNSIVFAYLY